MKPPVHGKGWCAEWNCRRHGIVNGRFVGFPEKTRDRDELFGTVEGDGPSAEDPFEDTPESREEPARITELFGYYFEMAIKNGCTKVGAWQYHKSSTVLRQASCFSWLLCLPQAASF